MAGSVCPQVVAQRTRVLQKTLMSRMPHAVSAFAGLVTLEACFDLILKKSLV